jgi:uncharacterized protein (TIGR03083 family)
MTTVRRLARLERLQFADLLDGLTGDQWAAATLCDGWRVRDVAAHTVAYLDQSRTRLAIDMVRSAGSVDRLNARALPTVAAREPADLVAAMRCGAAPSGAGASGDRSGCLGPSPRRRCRWRYVMPGTAR